MSQLNFQLVDMVLKRFVVQKHRLKRNVAPLDIINDATVANADGFKRRSRW